VICVAGCRYSLSLTVSRALDVGFIAEGSRFVVSPGDVCGQQEGSELGAICRMLRGWVGPLLMILLG
jgi:hypothetical protein